MTHQIRRLFRRATRVILLLLLIPIVWIILSIVEMTTGQRVFPWNAYAGCGDSLPETVPETVRIGLYEEFPVPWRLDKL